MVTPTSQNGSPRSTWLKLAWLVPAALVLLLLVVLAAKGLRGLPAIQSFIRDYPGESALPAGTTKGFTVATAVQHFLNAFFILFVIRTGWQIRTGGRPSAFWTRSNTGLLRTPNPPIRIGLNTWFHLTITALWVLNGAVFYVLIFSTGEWKRLVPVSWDVFPHAVSAGIQYASLEWPVVNGWVNYNGLQLLTYFITVFVAAPIAVLTGLRVSPGFAARLRPLDRVFPIRIARTIHFWTMLWFVGFIVVHLTLVLATGALRNLNHMYAVRDDQGWIGFLFFAGAIVLMIVAWIAATPRVLAGVAARSGTIRR
jgi:thiosulfate reductase cytochrome b subunit